MLTKDQFLDDYAYRGFLNTADEDYISARLVCRAQLVEPFLWGSQQALEKYLKCILLLRRVKAKDVGHSLNECLRLLEGTRPQIALTQKTELFIENIAHEAGPDRYLVFSVVVNWGDITELDRAVWELRRFCSRDPGSHAATLQSGEVAPSVRLKEGQLERILDDLKHPGRPALLWQNAFFGKQARRGVWISDTWRAINSSLTMDPTMIDELSQFVKVPQGIRRAFAKPCATAKKS